MVRRNHEHAPDHRADPQQSAHAASLARAGAGGRRRRPRASGEAAAGLRRTAPRILRRVASGNDDLDAPRSATGQAARTALAFGRRGRSGERGPRTDADEPLRARYLDASCRWRSELTAGLTLPAA